MTDVWKRVIREINDSWFFGMVFVVLTLIHSVIWKIEFQISLLIMVISFVTTAFLFLIFFGILNRFKSETYEQLQSYADILDDIEYFCKELASVEDTEGNSVQVRWRVKGYKEVYDKIVLQKKQHNLPIEESESH